MPKIILERFKCIGCGSCCNVCGEFFEMSEDGKSHLKESKLDTKKNIEEREINEVGCVKEAAERCPMGCIHIK
jgi:ferredoxin